MSKTFFMEGKLFPVFCYFLSLCVLILHGETLSVEVLKEMCGFKMSASKNSTRNQSMSPLTGTRFMACEGVSCLPVSFTWLKSKEQCPSLGQIHSQQKCGSCWAIAAAAVISDRHCLRTKERRIFSAKHIAGCAISDGGCYGGDPKTAMEYYVKQGVVTGGDPTIYEQPLACVPYAIEKNRRMSCETTCESEYDISFELDKRKGLSSYEITSQSVNDIKLDLMKFGPLVATMEIFDDFSHYKTGIYKHSPDSKSVGNHAVRLVGWGEENGTPFWLCANSFGKNWGEMNGFFRILAGQNECGIESYLVGVQTVNENRIPIKPQVIKTSPKSTNVSMMMCDSISCLPRSFTWLDRKRRCRSLGQIRYQLKCASSWAIAAAAVISDRHCLRTNEQRIFSAKDIAGCASISFNKATQTISGDGCYGGDPSDAMEYYVKQGVVTGGDPTLEQEPGCQPYIVEKNRNISCDRTCESEYKVPYYLDIRKGLSHYTITSRNVTEIKFDLMRFGPLVATMELFDDFRHYKNGIYKHSPSSKNIGNHSVRLMGWGDENGTPYWLCANSYGKNWGDMDGFFKILADQNECGIENYLVGVETQLETSIPMETGVTTTTKSDMMPINIRTTPTSSSIPLAVCFTSGNTNISNGIIRHNTGNIIGNFNTVCIHDGRLTNATITGRNNIICANVNGKVDLLRNQDCSRNVPSVYNCDNTGLSACNKCYIISSFIHCPPFSLSDALLPEILKVSLAVKCKSLLNIDDTIIKINDKVLNGSRNLICHNDGSVVGFHNVICRNDGTVDVESHGNQICVTRETLPKSVPCQKVERFCQTCDSHLMFKDC